MLALFGGFIAKKAFKLFNAWQDGNGELMKELGIDLNSALQQVTTGFFYINKVVGSLLKLAGNFTKSIAKLTGKIITFPFRVAGRIIRTAVRKAFVGIKRAIGPGMRKAIKGFFNIGKNSTKVGTKVAGEVAEKVATKSATKLAKRGLLGSIPLIGTGLDIWGAVSEGMKGNWVGAGLYTAGAITSLIPGMQGVSGVLSVSAMGQSIHQDLKRDAKNENINIEGTGDNVEISGMNNNNYNNLGVIEKPQPIINVVQPKTGVKTGNNGGMVSGGNEVPNIPTSNTDNIHTAFTKATFNAPIA